MTNSKPAIPLLLLALSLLTATAASGQQFGTLDYLCADWGPALTLPTRAGMGPQFSDAEDDIYFLKQVKRYTRLQVPDPVRGQALKDQPTGTSIYLCKMKPDGTGKTDVRQLWPNVKEPIDPLLQPLWMHVNARTRRIALSITPLKNELAGLWTMNLDGSDLKRILADPEKQRSYDFPSWTPDGQQIVFSESVHWPSSYRIAKCDRQGANVVYLTDGPLDRHPQVSPEGGKILYLHNPGKPGANQYPDANTWRTATLWLMNLDGKNKSELPGSISGTYPAWSPDGKTILLSGKLIEADTGKVLLDRDPEGHGARVQYGWAHWGTRGLVGYRTAGIYFTDRKIQSSKQLCASRIALCVGSVASCTW